MRPVKSLNILFFVVAVAACGHKAPDQPAKPAEPAEPVAKPAEPAPPATPPVAEKKEPEAAPAPPPAPHEDTFIKMSMDEKTKVMKTKVMPAMAKLFKDHDAKKFGKFDCKSCHGKGAGKGFKMPNPDLPKLDFAAMQAGKIDDKTKAMIEFMEKEVKPQMATILGLEQFDPAAPQLGGFGCLACHEMKK
jgi:hypothetical protein